MFKQVWLITLLCLAHATLANPIINEVMYTGNEWIEIYNPSTTPINMSGWKIADDKNTNNIICCSFESACSLIIPSESYAILTDQDSTLYKNLTTNAVKLCVNAKSLTGGLNDAGEHLTLFNSTYQTKMNYTDALGGYKNDKSLERQNDGTFAQSLILFGTPGKANSVSDPALQYKNLIINELLVNPLGEDNLPSPLGEWIELYNAGSISLDLKSLSFKNKANQTLIISSTTLNNQSTLICPGCYKVIYRNGDPSFSLNDDYDEITLYANSQPLNYVSYSNAAQNISFSYDLGNWQYALPTPGQSNVFSNLCDLSLDIQLNQGTIVPEGEQNFTILAKTLSNIPQKISVHGAIKNAADDLLREYNPWNNYNLKTNATKTYNPQLSPGIYALQFSTINQSCTDINNQNNNKTIYLAVESIEFFDPYSTLYIDTIKSYQPNKTRWGDHLDISLFIYKGDETKSVGKMWAEKDGKTISESTTFSLPMTHQEYLMTLPLILNSNCDNKLLGGEITIFLSALNLSDNVSLFIEGSNENACQTITTIIEKEIKVTAKTKTSSSSSSSSSKPKLEYNLLNSPASIQPGEILHLPLQITSDSKPHNFSIAAYAYRGSHCYSCADQTIPRDTPQTSISLKANAEKTIDLFLKLDADIPEGKLSYKILIKKDQTKTPHEITQTLYVQASKSTNPPLTLNTTSQPLPTTTSPLLKYPLLNHTKILSPDSTSFIAYESNGAKANHLIPYILIISFALLSITLLIINHSKPSVPPPLSPSRMLKIHK